MNLTQQQLASLADVSTPTVSRFEQADRNAQLSSVLAILEVLGMTDKRTLIFSDPSYSFDASDAAVFCGQDGETRVRGRISREALDDHFSDRGRLRPQAAFKKHRNEIEAIARRKYILDQREPDGSVLIRTNDIA